MVDEGNQKLSAEERREKTLTAIAEEFARNGFEGTRMVDLADAADISEAMLVKLYESKENMYHELIQEKIDQTPGTPFPQDGLNDRSPREVLLALAEEMANRCEDDPTFLRLLYYSALEDNEMSDLFYEERIRKLRDQLSKYISDRIDDGTFREVDPDQAAMGFMGMICHVLSMSYIFEFPIPGGELDEELMSTFVELYLDGICT